MVVDRTRRQRGELDTGRGDAGRARRVRKPHDRVGVGHKKIGAHKRHAKRRVQPLDKDRTEICDPVAIGVTQKRDAVGAGHAGAGALHHQPHDPALDALGVLGLGRCVGFGDQHVAVGQHMQPAWMIEVAPECHHAGSRRSQRRHARGPALGGRNVDGRNQRGARGRQRGLGPHARRDRQLGHLAAGR